MFRSASDAPGVDDGVLLGSAQGPLATPPDAVGKIQMTIGPVTVMRDGGVVARVDAGEFVYQGDVIETGAEGAVGILFTDGTAFNLSSDARAVLNEFAYDPNGNSNSALLSLAQGKFAFIAGKVAKTGSLRIDTPVARIRGSAQDGGIGILTLAALTFSAIRETEAASRQDALLDDGLIAQYGTLEIVTKEAVPRVIIVDDPTETVVLRRAGSAVAVDRVTHTATRMADLQSAYRDAFDTQSQGQQGSGPPGSSGNPISNQPPLEFQLAPQPINNVLPGAIISPDIPILNSTPILIPIISPPVISPPIILAPVIPPPSPQAPTIALTAIAITNPSSATSIVNASAATAGFPITGTTSGVEDGRTVTVAIVNSSNQVVYSGTATVANGAWTVDISSTDAKLIPDGSYTVTASVSNETGTPAPLATKPVTVDTVAAAPSAPVLTAASDSGSSSTDTITNVTTPTVTGSGAEAGATVTLYDTNGTTVLGTAVADVTGHWSITSSVLSAGNHTLTATQTDLAGNTSAISATLSVTIDTAHPSISFDMVSFSDTGVPGDHITNSGQVTLSGTVSDNVTVSQVQVFNGTTLIGTATVTNGVWSLTTTLAQGTYDQLNATATDEAGNTTNATTTQTVQVDTTHPSISFDTVSFSDTGVPGDHITNSGQVTLSGTVSDNVTVSQVQVFNGTTLIGTATVTNGVWSLTTTLAQGTYDQLNATATDEAGNTTNATTTQTVQVDTTHPSLSFDTVSFSDTGVPGDHITNSGQVTLSGTVSDNVTVSQVQVFNGTTLIGTATVTNGVWSLTTTLAQGTYDLACTRFRRHRVRCHSGAGGGLWNANAMHESSSLRL